MHFTIHFVGDIELADVWALLFFVYCMLSGRIQRFLSKPVYRQATHVYMLFVFWILLCELVLDRELNLAAKGLMVPIASYMRLLVFADYLQRDRRNVVYLLIANALVSVFFMQGMAESQVDDNLFETAFEGNHNSYDYVKFVLGPTVCSVILAITAWRPNRYVEW